jgi:hypothetical protein
LKLSNTSFAKSFHPSQNASPQAKASIEINQIKIVFVIVAAIQIFDKTIIKVKNIITTFAQVAIIFAVFCLVKFNA